jgi:L-alanine-DL-glutamate epimerase-like enolase superfamily enzyme
MARLAGLRALSLAIPFRSVFRHASAVRSETATVWVQAISGRGVTGHGEGCPREYVTGESLGQALSFVDRLRSSVLSRIHDPASLSDWIRDNEEDIDANPAAWCAVELALLDLFSRESDQSVEAALGIPELTGEYQYSAVLGDSGDESFATQLGEYISAGFHDFKIKVSGDHTRDSARIRTLRNSADGKARVRLDANNLWCSPEEAIRYIGGLGCRIFAVEEPLEAGDYDGAAAVSRALGIPVIVDESFLRIGQLDELASDPGRWILNLRVSKLGGLLRSLAIVKAARAAGLNIIIGAQVGETSLLTRAALTLARQSRDILVAQEGAFGTLLLEEDISRNSLMFGAGGRLNVGGRFECTPGFGLHLDTVRIERWSGVPRPGLATKSGAGTDD